MPDIEKVIKALDLCKYDPDPGQEDKYHHSCSKCPYWKDGIAPECAFMYTDAVRWLRTIGTQKVLLHEDGTIEPIPKIVRCKDCKHFDSDFCKNREWETAPEWFCADGKRR